MGALRRRQHWESSKSIPAESTAEPRVGRSYPRWLVVSSLIVYCTACWILIVVAGSWGVDLIRTATAHP